MSARSKGRRYALDERRGARDPNRQEMKRGEETREREKEKSEDTGR